MFPNGTAFRAKVAFSDEPATAMPRQFGPISRPPWARTSAEELLLACGAFRAGLGEARRDHAERADAAAQAGLGRAEDELARHADHREIDLVGDLVDGRVAVHAGDGDAVAVDGVRGAGEVRAENVAIELAADRAAPR